MVNLFHTLAQVLSENKTFEYNEFEFFSYPPSICFLKLLRYVQF